MNIIEVAQSAQADGVHLIRLRKTQDGPSFTTPKGTVRQVLQYDCKPFFTGSKRGWVAFDAYTASAVLAVVSALAEDKRPLLTTLPLPKLLKFVWANVS